MTDQAAKARWKAMCNIVADHMKIFTRPYVNILAGGAAGRYTDIGTGTFLEKSGVKIITCEHVTRLNPSVYFIDIQGSLQIEPNFWCVDRDVNKDVALGSILADEWGAMYPRARPLSMSKFAQRHATVDKEVLFFRGIAGENVDYIGNFGVDAILSGYFSQEKSRTGDSEIFEILWNPAEVTLTTGTSDAVAARVEYNIPAGFSGSLVWNTRFVELGCDFQRWSPEEAVVTGLLRRFDDKTNTLLAWRVEHLHSWL